mgnify:CR=1 FL=1
MPGTINEGVLSQWRTDPAEDREQGILRPDVVVVELRAVLVPGPHERSRDPGAELRGFVRNESNFDLQLQGFDKRLHLLLRDDIADIRREPGSRWAEAAGSAYEA